MRRWVLPILIGLLVIVPIAEIAVLIAVGRQIGPGWTILLVLATSALGGWLLRREGGRAWRAFQADLSERRPPGRTATDGLLVLVGGIFMLVPGFVSDVIGLFLILPPTRAVAARVVQHQVGRRLTPQASTSLFGPRRVRVRYETRTSGPTPPPQPAPPPPGTGGPSAIEGEVIEPGS
jgi:UPF0716 protein FxsA